MSEKGFFSAGPCWVETSECEDMKATGRCSKCGARLASLWPAFLLGDPGIMEMFRASSWVASCVPCGFIVSEVPKSFLEEPVDMFDGRPDVPLEDMVEPFEFTAEVRN